MSEHRRRGFRQADPVERCLTGVPLGVEGPFAPVLVRVPRRGEGRVRRETIDLRLQVSRRVRAAVGF